MKRILILGATGNIGAYASLHLKDCGYDVIACGRRKNDNGFFRDYGIEYISADICKDDLCRVLPSDVDAVVHLAGELPARYEFNPAELIKSITLGTLNVLEYIRKNNIKKIVFPQTPFDVSYKHNTGEKIYPDDQRKFPLTGDHSIYTIAKNAAVDLIEHYHAQYGISRYILRFFTIYQFHPNPYYYVDGAKKMMAYRLIMDKAMKGETIEIWGDPKRTKEIVYVKDLCRLIEKCIELDNNGGIYNVGGKCVSLEDQIKGIINVFSPKEHKSKVVYCPDKPNGLLDSFDTSKTEKDLGFIPKYSYIEAMKDLYEEMKINKFKKLWGDQIS